MIYLDGIKLVVSNLNDSDVDSSIQNIAVDGSVHGYFWGSHKRFTFDAEWISEEDKQKLRESRKNKVLMVLDNGERYNVRFSHSGFTPVVFDGVPVYNATITATEVVT